MFRRLCAAALSVFLLAAFVLPEQANAADKTAATKESAKKSAEKKKAAAAKKKDSTKEKAKQEKETAEQLLKRKKEDLRTLERELEKLKNENADPKKVKALERRIALERDDLASFIQKQKEKEKAAKNKPAAKKPSRAVAPSDQIEKAKLKSEAPRRG